MSNGAAQFEVNSFWGGGQLTRLEVLCLSSFVQNGACYNLYTYEEPDAVPQGIIVRDAAEILPAERMFRYPAGTLNEGSLSGYSNLFRYTLLQRNGGGGWTPTFAASGLSRRTTTNSSCARKRSGGICCSRRAFFGALRQALFWDIS